MPISQPVTPRLILTLCALSLAACAGSKPTPPPVIAPVETPAEIPEDLTDPCLPAADDGTFGGYIRALEGALIECNLDKREIRTLTDQA